MQATDRRTDEALPAESVAALERGNKIEAIKIMRVARGIGLKESKEAVEAYLASHPDVLEKLKASQRTPQQLGRLAWLVIAVVAVYMIVTRLF
jgi:ribosomal protein L7/L12